MALEINNPKAFSAQALQDLQSIASQAYGHGMGEKAKGGMGYMGLMKSADGTVSVFKCLTHKAEYKAFERAEIGFDGAPAYAGALQTASDNLKSELRRLATMAGLDADALNGILEGPSPKQGFLSRKMVAKAVTEIAKAAVKDVGADAKNFWSTIKCSGTVKDTTLTTGENGDTIGFTTQDVTTHHTALAEAQAMETKEGLPTSYGDLAARIKSGNLGETMLNMVRKAEAYVEGHLPHVSNNGCNETLMTYAMSNHPALFDANDDLLFASTTLTDPAKLTGWDKFNARLFRLELKRAMAHCQAGNMELDNKTVTALVTRAYVRSYFTAAAVEMSATIATEKGLDDLFLKTLEDDDVLSSVCEQADKPFDSKANTEYAGDFFAREILDGGFEMTLANADVDKSNRIALRMRAKESVSFVYSIIKQAAKEGLAKHTLKAPKGINDPADLELSKYGFDGGNNAFRKNGLSGEEMVNEKMFAADPEPDKVDDYE